MLCIHRACRPSIVLARITTTAMRTQHSHGKLFKPDGYLSQFVYNNQTRSLKKYQHLLTELPSTAEMVAAGAMAIGRLDQETEGLLLLTTDGRLSHFITKGRVIEKEYYAQVAGDSVSDSAIAQLAGGMEISLGGGRTHNTRPCSVSRLAAPPQLPPRRKPHHALVRKKRDGTVVPAPTTWLALTLVEGKKNQVRRMTAAVGHPTLRLVRVRVGDVELGPMQPGELAPWRPPEALLRRAHEFCEAKAQLRLTSSASSDEVYS